MNAERNVPLLVGFDVEPDGLDIPRRERRRWTGFERTLEIVGRLRPRLADALGVPVTFSWYLRMDPQIDEVYGSTTWVAETYAAELHALRAAGDELGLHPHALRWDDARGGWLAAVDDAPWVQECARVSFDAYSRAFGEPCRSHRYGDGYMGDEIVAVIRELGAKADLTVEPGRPAHAMSSTERALAHQFDAPRSPYQPDASNYMHATSEPSPDGLWMLPLTSTDPDPALPAWRRFGRRLRHQGRPKHRPVLIWAPWTSELLWNMVGTDVDAGHLSVLPFMVRVDTLLDPSWARSFEAHLLTLGSHRLGERAVLSTPSAVVAELERRLT